jgi:hypothetical protein
VKQVRNCAFHEQTSFRAWHITCDVTVAHACLQSLAFLSQTHDVSDEQSCDVGFARAHPGVQPVEAEKEHSVFAAQSAEDLAFEHVPMQLPLVPSHAQRGSAAQGACVLYLYWQRAVHAVPLTTWHVADAPHVAGSAIAEHLPLHVDVMASHTQSVCDEQARAVVARKRQRVRHEFPDAWHIDNDSQVETLMGSVSETGI